MARTRRMRLFDWRKSFPHRGFIEVERSKIVCQDGGEPPDPNRIMMADLMLNGDVVVAFARLPEVLPSLEGFSEAAKMVQYVAETTLYYGHIPAGVPWVAKILLGAGKPLMEIRATPIA